MQNNPEFAVHPRTTILPWSVAQGDAQSLMDFAHRESKTLAFWSERGETLAKVSIDNRHVGYGDLDDALFYRWPSIDSDDVEVDLIALWHSQADAAKTRAKCYFIAAADGLIKIGFSIDPAARLKALQNGCPVDLAILALRDGGEARETAYHYQFAEHRVRGEWFARHPDILAEIARINKEAVA